PFFFRERGDAGGVGPLWRFACALLPGALGSGVASAPAEGIAMRFPFPTHDPTGLHYAVRIFLGSAALWLSLGWAGDTNRIWAVISLIVVTEPRVPSAWLAFLSRTVNTILGCLVGLLFL